MKRINFTLASLILAGAFGAANPAAAQYGFGGEYASDNWAAHYMQHLRPMAMKMPAADKKKAMDMEMAIMKMEADHAMTMSKMSAEHKMTIAKMRRELEELIFSKGAF
jgi:hypothetical protein